MSEGKWKQRAKQLKTDIPAVYLMLRAKETSAGIKVLAWLTVAYALSPVDLIPDFIPVLGYLDDLLLLPALVALLLRLVPKETFERYREEAAGMWEDGKPKRWFYALPIVAVWVLLLLWIGRLLLK